MKRIVVALAVSGLVLYAAGGLLAQGGAPAWAFLSPTPGVPREVDDGQPKRMPGSSKALTLSEIEDNFNAADWFPDDHPPMPDVVAHGRAPGVRACAK